MQSSALSGGFKEQPTQSARAFRALLDVMARPGTIRELAGAEAPKPLSRAAATLLLTLTDRITPVHLAGRYDTPEIREWLTFQTAAPLVLPGEAVFAVGTWGDLLLLERFASGTADYPDRSATLIVEMSELATAGVALTGPGIRTTSALNLPGPEIMSFNQKLFPLGLDLYLTAGNRVAALPRTTREAS